LFGIVRGAHDPPWPIRKIRWQASRSRVKAKPMAGLEKKCALAIHGGAGTISPQRITPGIERDLRAGLQRSLDGGSAVLRDGGSSLDAVVAAVRVLEDDPLFNAGRGAVFTSAGTHEMDAAIMDGRTLMAGSVGGVKRVKNPIDLARAVMEKSPHVMFAGEGAEIFAEEVGLEMVDEKYFYTEERWQALQRVQKAEAEAEAHASGEKFAISDRDRHGTVGAVALDRMGNLAAATSTGGNTNKRPGRLGDTPIIGAGTYANNNGCAISATGDGEYFIRLVSGHDISALMEYRGLRLEEAAQLVIDKVTALGGAGGLIAIDRTGNIALPFNTTGMYRGYVDAAGESLVAIYK
jgi:beta-aspartyl-peptidase (threonine type)